MSMTELAAAVALLQGTGALFVATNPDPADPVGANHFLLPSSGAILAAVATAIGRQPDVLCGKPSSTMGHLLMEKEAQDGKVVLPHRALMVGDRLMTDIQFGKGIGARTAVVLSGAEKLTRVEELDVKGIGAWGSERCARLFRCFVELPDESGHRRRGHQRACRLCPSQSPTIRLWSAPSREGRQVHHICAKRTKETLQYQK
ncbi:hypothetical protein JIQ42_02854 [Leishmania sp. Namibia]|uniref:hypothetical protein n=1 Tax=Leishmania sp. Namibia TaxID=2802991 RepID=UPI001B489D5A|nr:hypothetical protein JIQ42_02854 [Leishmania sp. Namibia]